MSSPLLLNKKWTENVLGSIVVGSKLYGSYVHSTRMFTIPFEKWGVQFWLGAMGIMTRRAYVNKQKIGLDTNFSLGIFLQRSNVYLNWIMKLTIVWGVKLVLTFATWNYKEQHCKRCKNALRLFHTDQTTDMPQNAI